MPLTVAVTGPTGEIGLPLMTELESDPAVGAVRGMARRAFDPAGEGWEKVAYRRGDILDRGSLAALFDGVDVAVHLAFAIFGDREETRRINLEGSRNVFEAAIDAGVTRLVYASSVAAYGFHPDNPQPLTETVPARGSEGFYYSAQKAELEALLDDLLAGSGVDAYVFRPCIVAGPRATMLIEKVVEGARLGDPLPALRRGLNRLPLLKPVLPDIGAPLQLVHHDDVARALAAAIAGRGAPGAYNLAGDGWLGIGDVGRALGWRTVPVPTAAVGLGAALAGRVSFLSPQLEWATALRVPVLMDTAKARRELDWTPRFDADETLIQTAVSAREAGLLLH
ncbi:MAG: Epimerase [Solirubrobacterales bacterium]|nr:Epimerase [Solirubrobacterales bacterium]